MSKCVLIFDYAKIFIVKVVNWSIELIQRYFIIPVSTVVFDDAKK